MSETPFNESYLQYQTNRSWIRKIIRNIYLWQVQRLVIGDTIDFGCGIGEQLSLFSKSSIGLEINKSTVAYCQSKGLNVSLYDPETDNYTLNGFPENKYQTLVISHVLEHLNDSDLILKKLMESCSRIGVKRVIIIVPCELGFKHDKTHITFINNTYLKEKNLLAHANFVAEKKGYFPFNLKFIGKIFTYNEFFVIYNSK